MATHNKTTVLATIRNDGIVPVFHHADPEVCTEVATQIIKGGLSTLEFTNRGDRAISRFEHLVAWAAKTLPDLIVGMGSVVDPATAAHAIDIGANFVFAPSFSPEVASVCNRRKVPYVPGCGSVTEVQRAYESGVDFVKLFPAGELGGPGFLKNIVAPCPWVEAIPTGGVEATPDGLRAWFDAGAPAVGMGSKLLPSDLVAAGDWDGVQSKITAAVSAVSVARQTRAAT